MCALHILYKIDYTEYLLLTPILGFADSLTHFTPYI